MRIKTVLSQAQNGQVYANLARAFHLASPKVEVAVGVMLDELMPPVERSLKSRRTLAGLVELLGQSGHEKVLDSPMQLGATHTQMLGNEVLGVIAGRGESQRMALHAATDAGVSEMITEYLLPVIASMLVGALAKLSRADLDAIAGSDSQATAPEGLSGDGGTSAGTVQLPLVAGGAGFSGSTGGTVSMTDTAPSRYAELAEEIRRTARAPGTPDPAAPVRRTLESALGLPTTPAGWINRMQGWSLGVLDAMFSGWRR